MLERFRLRRKMRLKSTPSRDHAPTQVQLAEQHSTTSVPLVVLVLECVVFSQTSHGLFLLVELVQENS